MKKNCSNFLDFNVNFKDKVYKMTILLDFIIALILGNILGHPLSDEGLGMTGSITTTIVLNCEIER
jgi:uncharacterized membrane protein YcaP (DUF421 family)